MSQPTTFPTADELRSTPVLHHSGSGHDLHREVTFAPAFANVRVWLSRGSVADGEPFERTVYVEVRDYIGGGPSWYDLGHYDGDAPVERVGGHSLESLGLDLVGQR